VKCNFGARVGKLARWDCPGLIAAGDWAPRLQVSGASSTASRGSSSGSLLHWHTAHQSSLPSRRVPPPPPPPSFLLHLIFMFPSFYPLILSHPKITERAHYYTAPLTSPPIWHPTDRWIPIESFNRPPFKKKKKLQFIHLYIKFISSNHSVWSSALLMLWLVYWGFSSYLNLIRQSVSAISRSIHLHVYTEISNATTQLNFDKFKI